MSLNCRTSVGIKNWRMGSCGKKTHTLHIKSVACEEYTVVYFSFIKSLRLLEQKAVEERRKLISDTLRGGNEKT